MPGHPGGRRKIAPAGAQRRCPSRGLGLKISETRDSVGLGQLAAGTLVEPGRGRCRAVRLVNHLSGRTIPLATTISPWNWGGSTRLTSADFTVQEARQEAYPGGQRVRIRMASRAAGHRLDLVYELGHAEFFLRRHLEFTPAAPVDLGQVVVWQTDVAGACAGQGFGDPVLLEDTFWGLEFPRATIAMSRARCGWCSIPAG